MGLASHEFGWRHGNKPEDIHKMLSSRVEVIRSKIMSFGIFPTTAHIDHVCAFQCGPITT